MLRTGSRRSSPVLCRAGATAELHWKQTLWFTSLVNAQSALLLGAGICPDMALLHCAELFETGKLEVCWPGWQRPALNTCVLVSESAYRKERVKVFAHWLHERLSARIAGLRRRFPAFYADADA